MIKPAPITAEQRVTSLDTLRGVALSGVLLVNLVSGFRVPLSAHMLGRDEPLGWGGDLLLALVGTLVEFKAFALFSLLFGVGVAIQAGREDVKSGFFFLCRFGALLMIGLVHMFFVWNGDILTLYAVCGLLLIPLVRLSAFMLVALGLLFIVFPYMVHLPVRIPDESTLRELTAGGWQAYRGTGWGGLLAFRWRETVLLVVPLLVLSFPKTLGLMLWGAAAWRGGLIHHRRRLWQLLVAGTAVGLTGIAFRKESVATIPVAVAYGAALMLWSPKAPRIAAAGRMAFTNYLLQSIAFGFVFYGYGFGRLGEWSVGLTLLAGVMFYCAQLAVSGWWLKRFYFGPFEWFWRSMSYAQWQPFVREDARTYSREALFAVLPVTFAFIPVVHLGVPLLIARLGPKWGWRDGRAGIGNWLSVIPIFAGLFLLCWILVELVRAVRTLPPRVRLGLQPAQLIVTGPYAIVRHPMYAAESCLWIGAAVLSGSPLVAAVFACGATVARLWLIPREEEALANAFGERYRTYCARVRMLPRLLYRR